MDTPHEPGEVTEGLVVTARLAETCARIADFIEADLDQLEANLWEAMRDAVASYRSSDPETVGSDIRETARGAAAVFVRILRDPGPPTEAELAVFREIGARRARQGIPFEDFCIATRSAQQVGYEWLHTHAAEIDEPQRAFEHFGHLMDLLRNYLDRFITEVEAGYTDVSARDRCAVVADIVDGVLGSEAEIRGALERAVGGLPVPCSLLVFGGSDGSPADPARLGLGGDVLWSDLRADPHEHVVALAPKSESGGWHDTVSAAHEAARAAGTVVLVHCVQTLEEIAPTYQWLRDVLPVAVAIEAPGGLVEATDYTLEWLTSHVPRDVRDVVIRALVPGWPDTDRKVRERGPAAIRALVQAEGGMKGAAEILDRSERTMSRRLADLREATGLNHQVASHRARLMLLAALVDAPELGGDAPELDGDAP